MSLLSNWREVIATANLSGDKQMDPISKWLIITRASVFSMTATSGFIGGLLAAAQVEDPNWGHFGLALLGLVLAHAANNMINDFFDLEGGVDTDEYARAQYAPHPILNGMISKRGLLLAIVTVTLVDAFIMLVFISSLGIPVLSFEMTGLFISLFYVAPPIRLKHIGLGEPGVFLVWGPLMIGGTYFVTAGELPSFGVWLASVPYALIVTTVLIGKHIDKIQADRQKGIRTLPVLIGERQALWLNMFFMASYYIIVAWLVIVGTLGIWVLLTFLAIPRLIQVIRVYRAPRPQEPPPDYPVWPLWYVSAAFFHNKRAGGLFVVGLVMNLIFPILL